jgi:uncharacterized membrane protein
MSFSYWVIELSVFALALTLIPHARSQGKQWVSTYACGVLFGTAIELLIVSRAGASYRYGDFWLMLGPEGKKVPLWVGVGWGAILYAATWTAYRLKLPRLLRPLAAGVLAVNIDMSLDPIAHHLGYWKWLSAPAVNLYGVPFDNFLGWFAIVASYSFFVREGFDRYRPETGRSYVWVPPLSAVLATVVMVGVKQVAEVVYALPGGETGPFVLVFGVSCAIAWGYAVRSRRDQPVSWPILGVPLFMHGLLWLLLFTTGTFADPLLTSLIVLIPMNLFVGFFAYGWVSLENLFPVAERSTQPSPEVERQAEAPARAAVVP